MQPDDSQRIKIAEKVRSMRGSLTQSEFASRLLYSREYISEVERGVRSPNARFIRALEALEAKEQRSPPARAEALPASRFSRRSGYVRLPLMDVAASAGAGTPSNPDFPEVLEWINVAEWRVREWLGLVPKEGRVRLLTVRGDSMEPRLKNGDVCAIDTHCARFEGDGVYLLTLWENLYIKRLQLMTDGLHIISDNAALYKSEIIKPSDLDTVRICGRVLGAIAFKRSGEV